MAPLVLAHLADRSADPSSRFAWDIFLCNVILVLAVFLSPAMPSMVSRPGLRHHLGRLKPPLGAYLFRNAEKKAVEIVVARSVELLPIPLCRNVADGLKQVQLCSREG